MTVRILVWLCVLCLGAAGCKAPTREPEPPEGKAAVPVADSYYEVKGEKHVLGTWPETAWPSNTCPPNDPGAPKAYDYLYAIRARATLEGRSGVVALCDQCLTLHPGGPNHVWPTYEHGCSHVVAAYNYTFGSPTPNWPAVINELDHCP